MKTINGLILALLLLTIGLMCGCQFATYNVTIEGGSSGAGGKHAKLKYKGHEADADTINIIYLYGSPVEMPQNQEDVGNPDVDASGLPK